MLASTLARPETTAALDEPLSCRSAPGLARLEVHVLSSPPRDSLAAAVNRHRQSDRSRLCAATPSTIGGASFRLRLLGLEADRMDGR